jgi:hypothetical protein
MGKDTFKIQKWDSDDIEMTGFEEVEFDSLEEAEDYWDDNPIIGDQQRTLLCSSNGKSFKAFKHSKIDSDPDDITKSELAEKFFNAYSVLFDGLNSGIDFGDNYDFDINAEYTISFWVKAKSHGLTIEGVIGKKDDDTGHGWAACIMQDNKICWTNRGGAGNPGNAATIFSKEPILLEKWNHLLFTKSKGTAAETMTIYCNGEQIKYDVYQDNNKGTSITGVPLRVALSSTNKFAFKGNITQMFISDKQFGADEVKEIYGKGRPRNLKKLSCYDKVRSWWKIGQKDVLPQIKDSKGTIHGTAINLSSFDTDIPKLDE